MGFEILAAIDLLGGRVVRLRQGDFDQVTTHVSEPVVAAEALVGEGAPWLHVVDLDGAREGRLVHGETIGALVQAVGARTSIEVGGGIRGETSAAELLATGVDRVVLGTAALRDPGVAKSVIDEFGPGRVAVAIDVRDGRAVGEAWQAGASSDDPEGAIRRLAGMGVEIFEVTAVDRDGTLEGPDLELLGRLADLGLGRIIASGGIRSIDDLEATRDVGCAGAIVGRALYEARIDLRQAVAMLDEPAARASRSRESPR